MNNEVGEGRLTYCAVGSLGLIPVVRRKMMESAEDVLAGDTCEGGWRVGPRDESGGGGRRGHGYLEELAGMGRVRAEGSAVIRVSDEPIVRLARCDGIGRCEPTCRSIPLHKKGSLVVAWGPRGKLTIAIKSIYHLPIARSLLFRLIRTPP